MAAPSPVVDTREAVKEAADALLLEGVRPSVNAIRARLGRGSDTTIAAALKDWWTHLGQRLADLEARPNVPDAVWKAADTLWTSALDEAQQTFETEREALQSERQKAQKQVQAALLCRDEAEEKAAAVRKDLAEVRDARQKADATLAGETARSEALRALVENLQARLKATESHAVQQVEQFERQRALDAERLDRVEERFSSQLDAAKRDYQQNQARLAEERTQARKTEDGLRKTVEAAQADNIRFRQQFADATTRLREHERDSKVLREQLDQRNTELASRKAELDHAHRDQAAWQKDNKKLADAATRDQAQIQQLRERIIVLETRLETLNTKSGQRRAPKKRQAKKTK